VEVQASTHGILMGRVDDHTAYDIKVSWRWKIEQPPALWRCKTHHKADQLVLFNTEQLFIEMKLASKFTNGGVN